MNRNFFYDFILIFIYSCFPVIYLFSFNYEKFLTRQYEYFNVLTTCVVSFILFIFIYVIASIITKKTGRLITIILIFFFYSFGDSYYVLHEFLTFDFKKRYYFIIYLLLFVLIFLLFRKVNKKHLVIFCILIYIAPVFNIFWILANHNNIVQISSNSNYVSDNHTKRSVYYIILDGFINLTTYQDTYPDRHKNFITKLDSLGITILNNTWTAYPNTIYSIPSTLNLNYIYNYNYYKTDNSEFHDYQYYYGSNNIVYKIFDKFNYKIILNSKLWGNTENIKYDHLQCERLSEFQEILFDNSIAHILDHKLMEHFNIQIKSNRANEILCQFDHIKKSKYTSYPKFMFSHINCPHPPYVFNKYGEKINSYSTSSNWNPENEYYAQLEYCSKLLISSLESLLNNYKNQLQPIIIIQSDHGAPLLDATLEYNNLIQHLKILNLQYLPGQNISFKEEINVNTFRKIFKNYFEMDFEYLQKHVFVTNKYVKNHPKLKFINVDSLIDKSL